MTFNIAGTQAPGNSVHLAQSEIFDAILKLDPEFQPRRCDLGILIYDGDSLWRPDLEVWEITIRLKPDGSHSSHKRLPIYPIEMFLRPLGGEKRVKNVAELFVGKDEKDCYCIEIRALLAPRVRVYERRSVGKAVIFLMNALADKLSDLTPQELSLLTEDVCGVAVREYANSVDIGIRHIPLKIESSST
jgi:hypothetical protein